MVFVAFYKTNIVVILAIPLLFVIIILITVLLGTVFYVSHSFNSLWLLFDNEVYLFIRTHFYKLCWTMACTGGGQEKVQSTTQ